MHRNDVLDGFMLDAASAHAPTKPYLKMEELAGVRTGDDFIRCTEGSLHALIPHEVMFGAIGALAQNRSEKIHFVTHNYPWGFLADIQGGDGEIACGLLHHWLANGEPQLFEPARDAHRVSKKWLTAFHSHDLRNFISHGVRAQSPEAAMTYFVFARIPGNVTLQHARVMKLIAPCVHLALLRVFELSARTDQVVLMSESPLSERQCDVLRWVRLGKTNWEIARILGIGEKAVKYHLGRIFLKLQVNNRTQAVVKAVSMKLIQEAGRPGARDRLLSIVR